MFREIRNSSKVGEKSGNFNIMLCQTPKKLNKKIQDYDFDSFLMIFICNQVILLYISLLVTQMLKCDLKPIFWSHLFLFF